MVVAGLAFISVALVIGSRIGGGDEPDAAANTFERTPPANPRTPAAPEPPSPALPLGAIQVLPRGFIEAVHDATFTTGERAGWPDDADVIGVSLNGDARAYPVSVLYAREMVIDTVGGVPIVVTWCPVCGTAMVHRRVVDGEPVVFGVQGALYLNAMTWWDHGTGSIWSQPLGEAIAGPLAGKTVDLLPSELTTWGAWRETHPDSVALAVDATATGLDLADLLIVVSFNGEVRGYSMNGVRRAGVVNETVGGQEIAVVSDPTNADRWAVFSRRIGDVVVELETSGEVVRDRVSGSTFDPSRGLGLDGVLANQTLVRLPAATSWPGFGPTRDPIFLAVWPHASVWWPERR